MLLIPFSFEVRIDDPVVSASAEAGASARATLATICRIASRQQFNFLESSMMARVALPYGRASDTFATDCLAVLRLLWLPSPDICYISPHDYGPARRKCLEAIPDLHASSRSTERVAHARPLAEAQRILGPARCEL